MIPGMAVEKNQKIQPILSRGQFVEMRDQIFVQALVKEVKTQNIVVVLRGRERKSGAEAFYVFDNRFFFDLRPVGII